MSVACCYLLALVMAEPGDPETPAEDDIPVVGRPADLPFSGASGRFFVGAYAQERTVPAEQPIHFSLNVTGVFNEKVVHPPSRIDLREVPLIAQDFYVEDVEPPVQHVEGTLRWRFDYRLKPRNRRVTEIPGVPFVYFDPKILPASKGFQVRYTEPIPIKVGPPLETITELNAPAFFFQFADGPDVLATVQPWRPPSGPILSMLLLAPPLASVGAYAMWRRLYPDSAARTRRRRSLAAQAALRDLEGVGKLGAREAAVVVARTLADYLRDRFDLPGGEPTPAGVVEYLRGRGLSAELADRVGGLSAQCDEGRFSAWPTGEKDLAAQAVELILALEAGT
jgi:hypothetical protein